MAAATTNLLTTDQEIIAKLVAILKSGLEFEKLSDAEKKFLFVAAKSFGYDSNIALYIEIKNHPEIIGRPPLPEDEFLKTTLNYQAVAANLANYLEDRDALKAQIETTFQTRTERDRELIRKLTELAALKRQTEVLLANANAQTSQTISDVNRSAKQKYLPGELPPLDEINATSATFVQTAAKQKNLTLSRTEEFAAVTLVSTSILAGLTDPANSDSLNEVLQAAIPKLNTPVSRLYQEIESKVSYTPIPRYDDTTRNQLYPNVSVGISTLSLPEGALDVPEIVVLSGPQQDQAETIKKVAESYSTAILLNPTTDTIMAKLVGKITPEEEKLLVSAVIADNIVERSFPTEAGAAAALVTEKLGSAKVDPAAIRVFSMGLSRGIIEQKAATDPNSNIAHFVSSHPNVLVRLNQTFAQLQNRQNALGPEVSPRYHRELAQTGALPPHIPQPTPPSPLAGITRQFQTITNRISGFLPGRAGQIFNVVTHPFQSLQSYMGNFIGNRIVGQFKNWLAEKLVSRIANETLKKGAEFILKQGLQQGVKLLAQQGLKRGLQALAQAANIAPGAGLVLAAAIELAWALGGKAIGAVGNAINGFFRSFTGEDLDVKAAVAAPLLLVGGTLAYLGSATAVAASSAAIILMGSTFVGFILYISVIGMAPIIAGIAHLESGQGAPYSVVSGGVVPEGCPSGWPVGGGRVTAGPRTVARHHHNVEAIDIGVGLGTPIIATHNGLAVSHQGSNTAYGNFVDVNGTCNSLAFTTRYGHMVSTAFEGERLVKQGDVIGYVDSTGNSTGNHIHYEIRGGNLGDINQFLPKQVPIGCDLPAPLCNVSVP